MYKAYDCPRMFSFTVTPLTRNRFSNDIEPAIEYPPDGPVGWTDGANINMALISRAVGSRETRSCEKLVATWAVSVSTSAVRPTTSTVSDTAAGLISISSGATWVGATAIV